MNEIRGIEIFYGINCLIVAGLFIYGMIAYGLGKIDDVIYVFMIFNAYCHLFGLFVFSALVKIIKRIENDD